MRLTNSNPYRQIFNDFCNENVSVVEGKNASLEEMVQTMQLKNRRNFNMPHNELKELNRLENIIFIDDKIFNAAQIINQIIEDVELNEKNLNFSYQDSFIKKYFYQTNVQGIFNQIKFKFLLRREFQCELFIPGCNVKPKGKLEISVTIKFLPSTKPVNSMLEDTTYNSLSIETSKIVENLAIKVSLEFCQDEFEEEDTYACLKPLCSSA